MALVLNDRVLETCTSPGTGAVSLLGAATGYKTFSAGVGNANTCYYTIADQSGPNWEVGIGTYTTAGNTLTRTTLLSSSTGSTVNFSSGIQNVYVTYPSEKAVYLDASSQVTLAGQLNLTNASNYNLYASGAGNNYMAGALGIGSTALATDNLVVSRPITGAASASGVVSNGQIQIGVTSLGQYFATAANQIVGATTGNIIHYATSQGTFSGTVTYQFGFYASATLTGATNNYGFYSNIASGTNRFNFYAADTAQNVFVGQTSLGGNVGSESLRATPTASAVNYVNVIGAITTASPAIQAAGSDTNIDLVLTPKGTGVLSFGTYTAGVVAQAGYISIKDAAGNTRRLLVG